VTAYQAVRATATDAASFAQRGRDVATIARVAYREGQASLVELLDAERASADALFAHIRWVADAWLARLELERALGVRLDADGPLDLPLRAAMPPTSR
jgi:outer membrane protein, heavy metal efflux system